MNLIHLTPTGIDFEQSITRSLTLPRIDVTHPAPAPDADPFPSQTTDVVQVFNAAAIRLSGT